MFGLFCRMPDRIRASVCRIVNHNLFASRIRQFLDVGFRIRFKRSEPFFFSIQIRIFVQSGSNMFLNPDQNFCVFQFPVVVGGGPYALMLWVAVPSLLILILNLVGGGPYAIYCSYCGWRSLRSDFLCFTKSENQLPSTCFYM